MIPMELYESWEERLELEELMFLADHGGGFPDCLVKHVDTPEDRLRVLRQMGFRVAERYDMPSVKGWGDLEPWVRLTNDIAVNLADGFVVRSAAAERGRGK